MKGEMKAMTSHNITDLAVPKNAQRIEDFVFE
jgi:hypothetical protein